MEMKVDNKVMNICANLGNKNEKESFKGGDMGS